MNAQGFGKAKLIDTVSTYEAVRGYEQYLIEQNGGAQSMGGTSGNPSNGISPSNPNLNKYMQAFKKETGLG